MRLKILKLSLLSVSTVIKFVYINKTVLVLTFKFKLFLYWIVKKGGSAWMFRF